MERNFRTRLVVEYECCGTEPGSLTKLVLPCWSLGVIAFHGYDHLRFGVIAPDSRSISVASMKSLTIPVSVMTSTFTFPLSKGRSESDQTSGSSIPLLTSFSSFRNCKLVVIQNQWRHQSFDSQNDCCSGSCNPLSWSLLNPLMPSFGLSRNGRLFSCDCLY